jgi:hypothetical protein
VKVDTFRAYEKFLPYLVSGTSLLDAGCSSLFFMKQGFRMTLVDASVAICRCADKLLGCQTLCMPFEEIMTAVW